MKLLLSLLFLSQFSAHALKLKNGKYNCDYELKTGKSFKQVIEADKAVLRYNFNQLTQIREFYLEMNESNTEAEIEIALMPFLFIPLKDDIKINKELNFKMNENMVVRKFSEKNRKLNMEFKIEKYGNPDYLVFKNLDIKKKWGKRFNLNLVTFDQEDGVESKLILKCKIQK